MAPDTREEAEKHVEEGLEEMREAQRILEDAVMVGEAFLAGEIEVDEFDERLEDAGVDRIYGLLFH